MTARVTSGRSPIPARCATRSRMIRRKFNLRGCRPLTPNEADYKHCLYGNLKFCTAPCIGNVTREQYLQQVLAACDFLAGQSERNARTARSRNEEGRRCAGFRESRAACAMRWPICAARRKRPESFERLAVHAAGCHRSGNEICEELARVLESACAAGTHRRFRHLQHQRHLRRRIAWSVSGMAGLTARIIGGSK